jgi:hypothetical protein
MQNESANHHVKHLCLSLVGSRTLKNSLSLSIPLPLVPSDSAELAAGRQGRAKLVLSEVVKLFHSIWQPIRPTAGLIPDICPL